MLSHTQDALLVSVESPLGPMEQPTKRHRQARSVNTPAAAIQSRCRVRRTERAGQRLTVPFSTKSHATPRPMDSERMLHCLALIKSRQQHECSACGAPCDTPLRPHCRHVLNYDSSSSQPEPRRLLRSLAVVARRSVRPALDASYTLPPGAAGAPPVDVRDVAGLYGGAA